MLHDAVLLSIRPRYAHLLFEGVKTIELRRVAPTVSPGSVILIYESAPTMALVGVARVSRLETGRPSTIWPKVRNGAGVSRVEYEQYFEGALRAAALHLRSASRFAQPIALTDLRQRWPWFRPPQNYRYVQASLAAGELVELAIGASEVAACAG